MTHKPKRLGLMLCSLLSLLSLVACKRDLGDRYHGLPDGTPSCSHDLVHQDRGTCVVDGKKYRCIWEQREDNFSTWVDVNCTTQWVW